MSFIPFIEGVFIGLALAAPVGPVGILCIRRALAQGRLAAFAAGLGAAFADTFYGAVAALGLTFIAHFLTDHTFLLRLVGGSFMLILGLHIYRQPVRFTETPPRAMGLAKDFVSTFLITLSNPATILAAMGIFAAIGALSHEMYQDSPQPGLAIIGVFVGSSLWWAFLSFTANAFKSRFTPAWIGRLNHISGIALMVFALVILGSLPFDF